MNREKLALAAGCAAFAAAVATAQAPPPGGGPLAPPYKNLQVFPKDITQPQLVGNMKGFAQALGVRCIHCHVGTEGQPLSTFDFASDAKPTKLIARKMLAMVHRINEKEFGVTEFKDVKVTCFTCHRGSTKPLTAPPPDVNLVPPPPATTPKAS
ncbi:c-type cytochrome [Sphingomonas sp.]|uniref:c-type cytochrome n=1 Tax=Sphingomonas sp. TaxID=28214 RepID=UPI0025D6340B|nr:c-type cytochrome [Sphingomonas sp.]